MVSMTSKRSTGLLLLLLLCKEDEQQDEEEKDRPCILVLREEENVPVYRCFDDCVKDIRRIIVLNI